MERENGFDRYRPFFCLYGSGVWLAALLVLLAVSALVPAKAVAQTDPTAITLTVDTDIDTDDSQVWVNENGGAKTVRVTATIDGAKRFSAAKDITIKVGQTGDTATEGTDYTTVSDLTLTIAAGMASGTKDFTLTPTNDVLDEEDESLTVSGVLTGVTFNNDNAIIYIVDDDPVPTAITLTVDADIDTDGPQTSVAENGGTKTVRVTATIDGEEQFITNQDITISIGKTTDTATEGSDYTTVEDFTLTIDAYTRSGTKDFTLTPSDDVLYEPGGESISVSGTLTGITFTDATIGITDDDTAPSSIYLLVDADTSETGTQYEVTEGGGAKTVRVTATIDGTTRFGKAQDITISIGKTTDTATEGSDYTTVEDFTLTIAAGMESGTKDFTLTPTDDVIYEPDLETITVSGALSGVTINDEFIDFSIDNDVAPSAIKLTVDADTGKAETQTSVAEDGGAKTVRVTATITSTTRFAEDTQVTIGFGDPNDSAEFGTDYTTEGDVTLTIVGGANSGTVDLTLTPTNDLLYDPDESISVVGTLIDVTVTGTTIGITDDDAAPSAITLTVDTDTSTDGTQTSVTEVNRAKTVQVTATITGASRFATDQRITISVGKMSDSAKSGTDYEEVFEEVIWIRLGEASGTVDILLYPIEDVLDEPDESLSIVGSGLSGVTFTDATISIEDDDDAPSAITLTVDADTGTAGTQSSVAENGGAKTVRVTATITSATRFSTNQDITISIGKSGVTAVSGTDYTAVTDKTLTIAAGADSGTVDFTLTPTNDVLDEPKETIGITGSGLSGVTFTDASITIIDDDPTSINLRNSSGNPFIAEAGGTEDIEILVGRALEAGETVTVPLTVTGATVGSHYLVGVAGATPTGFSFTTASPHSVQNPAVVLSGNGLFEGTIRLTAVDNEDTVERTLSIAYGSGSRVPTSSGLDGGISLFNSPVSVSIADNDGAITVAPSSAAEGSAVVFTITLPSAAPAGGVTIDYETSDGRDIDEDEDEDASYQTATSGTDYTAADSSVTIPAGSSSVTVPISTADDTTYEGDHYFMLELTGTNRLAISSVAGSAIGTITDAADLPSIEFSAAGSAVAEDAGSVSVTVSKTGSTLVASSVGYETVDGTAEAGADYTAPTGGSVSFSAAETSKTIQVAISEDVLSEGAETFNINLNGGDHYQLGTEDTHAVTINDNDAAPTGITLKVDADAGTAGTQLSVTEDGGARTVEVTATIDGATRFAQDSIIAITVGEPGDSAVAGTHYAAVAGQTITIAAGAESGSVTFTLAPIDNPTDAPDKSLRVTGALAGVTINPATIGIVDDDGAPSGIALTVDVDASDPGDQTSVDEDGGPATVRVTASITGPTRFATSRQITLTVGDAGDSAVAGTDYAAVAEQTITIAGGVRSASVTFTLTPIDDMLDESVESISVEGTLAGVNIHNALIHIVDDDEALDEIALTVDTDASAPGDQSWVAEEGGARTVQVTASIFGSSLFVEERQIAVMVGHSGDSATAGTDYEAVAEQTITIAAGARSGSVTFTLTPIDDMLDEVEELINVDGSLAGVTITNALISIIDDDGFAPGGIALTVDTDASAPGNQSSVAEEGGARTVQVTASIIGSSLFVEDRQIAVTVGHPRDGATAGTDYEAVMDQTITIPAGTASSSVTFTLMPIDDMLDESDEWISVWGTLAGVIITDATIVLVDNDEGPDEVDERPPEVDERPPEELPVISISSPQATEGDSGATALNFRVSLSQVSTRQVTVDYADAGTGSATSGADYTALVPGTFTFAAGEQTKTIAVSVIGDTIQESAETIAVRLSNPVNASFSAGRGGPLTLNGIGTIVDDDGPPVISITDANGGEGGNIGFVVSLSKPSSGNVAVGWATSPGTAKADVDYRTASGQLAFGPGEQTKTIEIWIIQDEAEELDEEFTVTLSNPQNGTLVRSTALGTISDSVPLPAEANVQIGGTIAVHVLDSIKIRVTGRRIPGFEGQIAGVPLEGAPGPVQGGSAPSALGLSCVGGHHALAPGQRFFSGCKEGAGELRTLDASEALAQSSFSRTDELADGIHFSIWGRGLRSGSEFSSGGNSMKNTVTSGTLGVDWSSQDRGLGLMLSLSKGEGEYSLANGQQGKLSSKLVAVAPWLSMDVSERTTVWGAAGIGAGSVTVAQGGREHETDLDWTMLALGAVGTLYQAPSPEGIKVNITSDAYWTQTKTAQTSRLKSSSGGISRLRLGLEGVWRRQHGDGAMAEYRLETGLRRDSGDVGEGWAIDVGGGVDLDFRESGYSLSFDGRSLITHENSSFRDWSIASQITFDRDSSTQAGPSFNVGYDIGAPTSGGVDTLFDDSPLPQSPDGSGASRLRVEAAYGFALREGFYVGSPYVKFSGAEQSDDYAVGWRMTRLNSPDRDVSLELDFHTKPRSSSRANSDYALQFGVTLSY